MEEFNFCLSEQLEKFLDNDLIITKEPEKTTDVVGVPERPPLHLNLLPNVSIDKSSSKSITHSLNSKKGPRKFSDIFRLRLKAKMFSSEKDRQMKCKEIAIDPDYILSRAGVFPWPEPKNIRHIEYYRKVKNLPNGSFVAAPISDKSSVQITEKNVKENNSNKKNNNNSINDKNITSLRLTEKTVKVKTKIQTSNNNNNKCNNCNDDTNNRKQKRKRGLKKKINKKTL